MVYESTAFSVLASGNEVSLEDPDPADITYADVERGLAHINRYNGQTDPLETVAHHSLLVSDVARERGHDERVQLYALLHDAPEAYLGDIPRPTKNLLDGEVMARYDAAEQRMLDAIHTALGLDAVAGPTSADEAAIDRIDKQMALVEAYSLGGPEIGDEVAQEMNVDDWNRSTADVLQEDWTQEIAWGADPAESRAQFRTRFEDLYERVVDR